MGRVTKDQIPAVAAFMPRFWEAIKATYVPELGLAYWRDTAAKLDATLTGLQGDPEEMALCRKLLLAYGEYLEEKEDADYKRYPKTAGSV